GFYWAADHGDIVTATQIAAHTANFVMPLERFEPVGWAEEVLDAATTADVAQLPRLYAAAAFCSQTGKPDTGLEYARRAVDLERDPKYEPLDPRGWGEVVEGLAHMNAGNVDMAISLHRELAARTGMERVVGLAVQAWALPGPGRSQEARMLADEAVTAARQH